MAKRKFYRPIFYRLLLGCRAVFSLLPLGAGLAFGGFIGRLAYAVLPKERAKVSAHLKIAFPEKSFKELDRLGAESFRNYGYTAAELALLHKLIPRFDRLLTVEGREHFDRGLAAGRGVIALTAHFGNWEILGGALSLLGYPGSVIARRLYYDKYDALMVGLRAKMKLKTIYRDESAREVLRAFKENRVVGIVADQDVPTVDGVFADFFGRPAFTPSAPVRFALKLGAPLIPCFILREQAGRHRIVIQPPVELQRSGDEEKDVLVNTQKWVSIQERMIRDYPHLWVWNHKRWKSAPKAENASNVSR